LESKNRRAFLLCFVPKFLILRKEFSWTRNQVRWARDKLIESGIISYSGGEKGKNGQYAFTEKVLRASHAQDARNSHALSALTDDSLQTPAEREEERSESILSEDSTRNSCATHAQVTRKPRARTLYINKTIQDKTKQEDSISPYGETKTLFSNPRRERIEDCPLRIKTFETERETAFHSVSMDKSIEPVSSETSSAYEALPSGEEKTFPVGKGEGEFSVRQDQKEIVGIPAIEQTEEETLECVEYNSCSKFERDVMETWEVLIGPFESHWIPLLRDSDEVLSLAGKERHHRNRQIETRGAHGEGLRISYAASVERNLWEESEEEWKKRLARFWIV